MLLLPHFTTIDELNHICTNLPAIQKYKANNYDSSNNDSVSGDVHSQSSFDMFCELLQSQFIDILHEPDGKYTCIHTFIHKP
jgi:hypothetical protein